MKIRILKSTGLNPAEWLPLIRLCSVPFLLVLIFTGQRYLAGLVFLLSFCTDALDGFVARVFHWDTRKLSRLDSTADMLLLSVGLLALLYFESAFFLEHFIWVILVLALYFGQLGFAYYRYRRPSSFHTLSARIAALVQTVFITYSLYYSIDITFFYTVVFLSVIETTEEILLIANFPRYPGQVNSILMHAKNKPGKD